MRPLVFTLLAVASTVFQQDNPESRRIRYEHIEWPMATVQITVKWNDEAEAPSFKMTVPTGWRGADDQEVTEGMTLVGETSATSPEWRRSRVMLTNTARQSYTIAFEKGEGGALKMDHFDQRGGVNIV